MTMRPDPTFHASPKLAMEAPPESFAYTLLLSPDFSKPDALAVIDVKPGSPTYSQIVHTVTMPNKGDEFHHFGWNACSSALSPLTGHAFVEHLLVPLEAPSVVQSAIAAEGGVFHGPLAPSTVNSYLYKVLGCGEPAIATSGVITIGKRVVNVLYGHGADLTPLQLQDLRDICAAAAEAYARLIAVRKKK